MADKQNDPNTFPRSGTDLVAVNPERVITLMQLAVEHYGDHCGRCNRKLGKRSRPTVHHRHYRTLGFEKPVDDIVLLCHKCHTDLHTRAEAKLLTKDDIPFVDPQWAANLQNRRTAADVDADWPEGIYNPRVHAPAALLRFKIVFKTRSEALKTVYENYPSLGIARQQAEQQRTYYSHASVESVEEL